MYHNVRDKYGRFISAKSKSTKSKTTGRVKTTKVKVGNTYEILVIDCSSSMYGKEDAIIKGYNKILANGKKEDLNSPSNSKTYLTDIRFSSARNIEIKYSSIAISNVPNLNSRTYVIGGMTALNDAIAIALDCAKAKHIKSTDRVNISIFTDGAENASNGFRGDAGLARLRKLVINGRDNLNYGINIMGTGPYVETYAKSIGIFDSNVLVYENTFEGTVSALNTYNNARINTNTTYRSTGLSVNKGFFQQKKSNK